jgi:uncharacterized protein YkwD
MNTKGHKTATILIASMLMTATSSALAADDSSFAAHYTTASLSAQEQTAGNLLNNDRARYNLAPLVIDPALCRIARIKSEDMRDKQYFAHTSPTYGDVRQMLSHFGYKYSAAGENIAHHASIEKAQAAFLSSPGHRKNVLSSAYTKVGLGAAIDDKGFVYLTQIFAR